MMATPFGRNECPNGTYGERLTAATIAARPKERTRLAVSPVAGGGDALARVQRENETLYAVIKTVSSSLDLSRVLDGIVEIATDATDCHAAFIYFVEDDRLLLRAASPRYSHLVGTLGWGLDEGLTGWV